MNKKRNNLYVVILYLLMLCGATACTDATDPAPGGPEEPAAGTIRLTLSLPGKTPVNSRAATTIPGTPEENRIDSIRLYAFMATDGGAITGNAILENIYTLATEELTLADGDGNTYTANLRLNETGVVRLVAVANPEATLVPGPLGDNGLRPGITYAKFCTAVTLSLSHTPRTPLLMWGDADGTVTTDGTTPLAISLTRSVARIDVVNNTLEREEDGTLSATQPQGSMTYNIERISLVNAPSAAWLTPMPEGNERTGTPPATPLLTQQQATIDLATHQDWQAAYAVQRIAGGLYCFPTTNADAATTVRLAIEGKLNGQPVRHIVAWEEGQPIQPNRLYHVVIDSVQTTIVHARILVSEWEDGGEIDYSPTAGTLTAELLGTDDLLVRTTASDGTFIFGTMDQDMSVGETMEYSVDIRVTSDYIIAEVWKDREWIVCEATSLPVTNEDGKIEQTFTVTVGKPAYEEGSIEFFNPAKPYEKALFRFVHDDPENPLARFAHVNLEDDRQIGTVLTESTAAANPGGLFQWGRNIAVSKTAEGHTSTKRPVSEAISDNTFITAAPWFSDATALLSTDSWYTIAGVPVPGGQPNGAYRGDPCPPGWRMPVWDDIKGIASLVSTAITGSNYVDTEIIAESPIETGPAFYAGDGLSGGSSVVYGMKKMGTADTYALRYKKNITSGVMEVTCIRTPGLTATAKNDFTNGTIDWEDPLRVVRYFPAGGYRNSSAVPAEGSSGYYSFNVQGGSNNGTRVPSYHWHSTCYLFYLQVPPPNNAGHGLNTARSIRCVRTD